MGTRSSVVSTRTWQYGDVSSGLNLTIQDSSTLIDELAVPQEHRNEVFYYLREAFGNPVRIDYGTGHELSFLGFLGCLDRLGLIENVDLAPIGLYVFPRYLQVVRSLQLTYSLEPAGSHGVWGLDDYQFLPFIWGSAQLIGGEGVLPPTCVLDQRQVQENAHAYMYFGAIDFINKIKRGRHFGEHSPVLYDITAIPKWERINSGLFNMYRDEVLRRFPVVQHFYFGTVLPFD